MEKGPINKESVKIKLNHLSTSELIHSIHTIDAEVYIAVGRALSQITALTDAIYQQMKKGKCLYYIGAGTSGRLGVLDAAELPPTYGVSPDWVKAIIAGGDMALRRAVEGAEDDVEQGWMDLISSGIKKGDFLLALAASGTTPYVLGAVREAKHNGIQTGCIACKLNTPLANLVDFAVEVNTGEEIVAGSTRMKAATAQKMALNMISTSLMVKLGRTDDNRMVFMQLKNEKLIDRGTHMLMDDLNIDYQTARELLLKYGAVNEARNNFRREHLT